MKMKSLFALLSVFAICICMAIPTTASASVHDDDVGFAQSVVAAPIVTTEFSPMIAPSISSQLTPTMISTGMEATFTANDHTKLKGYWSGGDSKASIRKACLNNLFCKNDSKNSPIFPHRRFGKDIRRLSFEAKA